MYDGVKLRSIFALHQNPIDLQIGAGIRTVNILKLLKRMYNADITLFTLGNDAKERQLDGIKEKHIPKPFYLRKVTGGYLCIYPIVLANALKHSELAFSSPDITVFETPLLGYATLKTLCTFNNSIKIYDAHNVEFYYWHPYFENKPLGKTILRKIQAIEKFIIQKSDYVFVTSKQEKQIFQEEYGVNEQKLVLVPNGVDTTSIIPLSHTEKLSLRNKMNWGYQYHAVFIGSAVKANIDACRWIINSLANTMNDTLFIIMGSVCQQFTSVPKNVKLLGVLDRQEKDIVLRSSDVAINPMFFGAGTNLKMLEYMAAGLPIVTTPVGARGLDIENHKDAIISDINSFSSSIRSVFTTDSLAQSLAANSRAKSKEFDWEIIGQRIKDCLPLD